MIWLVQQVWLWMALAFLAGALFTGFFSTTEIEEERWVPTPEPAAETPEDEADDATVSESAKPVREVQESPFPQLQVAAGARSWEDEDLWSRPVAPVEALAEPAPVVPSVDTTDDVVVAPVVAPVVDAVVAPVVTDEVVAEPVDEPVVEPVVDAVVAEPFPAVAHEHVSRAEAIDTADTDTDTDTDVTVEAADEVSEALEPDEHVQPVEAVVVEPVVDLEPVEAVAPERVVPAEDEPIEAKVAEPAESVVEEPGAEEPVDETDAVDETVAAVVEELSPAEKIRLELARLEEELAKRAQRRQDLLEAASDVAPAPEQPSLDIEAEDPARAEADRLESERLAAEREARAQARAKRNGTQPRRQAQPVAAEPQSQEVEQAAALEAERLKAERAAEARQRRAEQAKAKREEAKRLKAEQERAEHERAEQDRVEQERAEQAAAEQLAAEQAAALEAERLKAERAAEAKRRRAEQAKAKREEAKRLKAEQAEQERLAAERAEAERAEAERIEHAQAEIERLERVRVEAERVEAERLETERLETERLQTERIQAERAELARAEAERAEAERAAVTALEVDQLQAPLDIEQIGLADQDAGLPTSRPTWLDPEDDSDAWKQGPYGSGSAYAPFDGSEPAGHPIKGNLTTNLYYSKRSRFYSRTHADVFFATEEHAEAAGFTRWDKRATAAHTVGHRGAEDASQV